MFHKELVNEVNPLDIYKTIKEAYLKWHTPDKIYIDFTGGTKAMSAAAAMVGAIIDLQLIYVGTESYLRDFRKPTPGSETLYYINNPYAVFGDFEIEKAVQLFGEYNYAVAREKLEELKEKVPDPMIRQQLQFIYFLAQSYEHWDALEFDEAFCCMANLVKALQRDCRINEGFLLMDCIGILQQQLLILESLSKMQQLLKEKNQFAVIENIDYIIPLMFTMQTNALIREKQEKYDSATLLLYRLLEMIGQRRLAIYGIDVAKADYSNIKYDSKKLPKIAKAAKEDRLELYREEVVGIKEQIFGSCKNRYLSEQISLLEGFIYLAALKDEIMTVDGMDAINKLKHLRSVVYLRNNSIFAHGFTPVNKTNYLKFKDFVLKLFEQLCDIEGIDYEDYTGKMTWINPSKTKNYTLGIK